MKTKALLRLLPFCFLLMGCMGDEPLGIECDIETIELRMADYTLVFDNESEHIQQVPSENTAITFAAKSDAKVGSFDTWLTITPGAKAYWVNPSDNAETPFQPLEGNKVHYTIDYSDQVVQTIVVRSESYDATSKHWERRYTVQVALQEAEDTVSTVDKVYTFLYEFNEGSYHLFGKNPNKNNYYVWEETEDSLKVLFRKGDYTWKNGNPGFKIANSSLSPMEYPTVPVLGGGPDGSDCIKLETKSAGKMGEEVGCPTAAGSLFLGTFTAEKALASKEEAVKATLFGIPFTHIPTKLEIDLKLLRVGTATLADGTAFTDEPDVYCVIYDNEGGNFVLDGGNVLTDRAHIKAIARLPHQYDGIYDKVSVNPIHGLVPGGDWQHVTLPLDYDPFDKTSIDTTSETRLKVIDLDKLKKRGYSIAIGASSSWQGGDFHAFIGQAILLDNLKLTCVDPATSSGDDDPGTPIEDPKDDQCELAKITIGSASTLFDKASDAVQTATDASSYTFYVKADANLSKVPVTFEYSEKATMFLNGQPFENGSTIDFSSGQQTFELVSEDEQNRRSFTLNFVRIPVLTSVKIGNANLFEKASDAEQSVGGATTVTFKVLYNADLSKVPVTFAYTQGAQMYLKGKSFSNGTQVDFTGGEQSFELRSSDGVIKNTYTIKFERLPKPTYTLKMNFNNNYALNGSGKFYEWTEAEAKPFGTSVKWGTTNLGYSIFRNGQQASAYPVIPAGAGHEGNCVRLKTLSNSTLGTMANKRFTPGMLFLGYEGAASSPQTVSPENLFMGVPFKSKPLSISAYLKYTPGTQYQDKNGNAVAGVSDEPDFYCVIYKNTGGVQLTAVDVLSHNSIVGFARLSHPLHGIGTGWTKVTLDIQYKSNLTAADFASGQYSLVICASSSYNAAQYSGAEGSELYVDDIELEYE